MATQMGTPAADLPAELAGLPPCDQVGVVVRDLERAMAMYAPLFGPFTTMDGSVQQASYRGRLVVRPTLNPNFRRVEAFVADADGQPVYSLATIQARY